MRRWICLCDGDKNDVVMFGRTLILLFGVASSAFAQGIITTAAGSDYIFADDNTPAVQARLAGPVGLAADPQGNYYIAEPQLNLVMKVDRNGLLTVLAGNGLKRLAGEGGLARAASIGEPRHVATDAQGNVYIASEFIHRIFKVDRNGIVTVVAGRGFGIGAEGGQATQTPLEHPSSVGVDAQGNVYYGENIETLGSRVRRVSTTGIVTTVAGNINATALGDGGPATNAGLSFPQAVVFDSRGNMYISESGRNRIRRVSNGVITTFAGGGNDNVNNGIPATQASLANPGGLLFDPAGNLLVVESGSHRIRRITSDGMIATIAGTGNNDFAGDGNTAANASFSNPVGIAMDSAGNLLIADRDNQRVRRLLASGIVETAAGRGGFTGDGGAAILARLVGPVALAMNAASTLYIADPDSHRIRQVTAGGQITTLVGTGRAASSPDNTPAGNASIVGSFSVAVDAANNVYFDENCRIRRVTTAGILNTFAGNANCQFSGDGGPAINAGLTASGMTFDRSGNLYIADVFNARIRRITPAGVITTIAGNGLAGYSGDGGPALQAAIRPADGIAVDASGGVYFTEFVNHRVRKISNGTITTFAGNGLGGRSGDGGPAADARVGGPFGLGFDSLGNLYIATAGSVRRVSPTGVITQYTGNRNGFSGDGGSALNAAFNFVRGLVIDANNNLYIADVGNQRVRVVQAAIGPSIVLSQKGLTFRGVLGASAPSPQSFTVVNGGQGPLNFGVFPSTLSGGPNWLSVAPATGSAAAGVAGVPLTVSVNPTGLPAGDYYGQVEVRAATAANSPQSVTIVLNVLAAGANGGLGASPSGVLFTAVPGGANPAAQTITLSNFSPRNVSFGASASFGDGRAWLTLQTTNGNIVAGQTTPLRVAPSIAGFGAGVYNANITVAFSDGTTSQIQLLLVVAAGGTSGTGKSRSADGCTPTKLLPLVTSLGPGFRVTTSWPAPLELRVIDDCGQAMTRGAVAASFSNGDTPVVLVPLLDGRWSGTWQARGASSAQVTVTFDARLDSPVLNGSAQVGGGVDLNANPPPDVGAGGVVDAASFRSKALAPGSLISIFGSLLSQGSIEATSLPLPTRLGGTTVVLAGRPLPLLFAGPGQINAMVPYDLPVDATHQLLVRRGSAISVPEAVSVLSSQAGVFTNIASGFPIVVATYGDGSYALVSPQNPLKAGDVIVIYCTGLGDVEPRAIAGVATPFNELSRTTEAVKVRIGGVEAEVFFAGLTPGFTGLYQVNATVPAGVTPGEDVPLLLEQSARQSQPVKIVVR